jgi:hypothetical protein
MAGAGQAGIDWPALLIEAMADIKANKPLPAAQPLTDAQIQALLLAMQTDLPVIAAKVQSNPGVIMALGRVLGALAGQGETWAGTLKDVLDALPGGLSSAEQYIPTILGLLNAFAPATGGYWSGAPNAI